MTELNIYHRDSYKCEIVINISYLILEISIINTNRFILNKKYNVVGLTKARITLKELITIESKVVLDFNITSLNRKKISINFCNFP